MKRKRRTFSAAFKLKVILSALQERETLSELSQKYELHPNQISKWKTEFLDNAAHYLQAPDKGRKDNDQVHINELYAKKRTSVGAASIFPPASSAHSGCYL